MFKTIHKKGLKCITLLLSLLLSFNAVGVCYAEGEQEQPIVEKTSEVEETTEEESEEITEGNEEEKQGSNEEELPDSEDINSEGNDEQIQQENNENDISVIDDTDSDNNVVLGEDTEPEENEEAQTANEDASEILEEHSFGYIPSDLDSNTPVINHSNNGISTIDTLVPSSYQTNIDYLKVTYPEVRDQEPYGTCWAFSTLGLMEFDLIHSGQSTKDIDLSELQLAYFTFNNVIDPLGGTTGDTSKYYNENTTTSYLNYGGSYEMAIRRLSQWIGAIDENILPYSKASETISNDLDSSYAYNNVSAYLQNAYLLNIKQNPDDVKVMIMQHGAVGINYSHYYDGMTSTVYPSAYFDNGKQTLVGGGHAVMVVGWDDNYSVDNFKTAETPTKNGAWLVRNSWGFTESYFWMSYETASLNDTAYVLDCTNTRPYDNNYQLDGGLESYKKDTLSAYNKFTTQKDETLKAVSVSFTHEANVNYTIDVYTSVIDKRYPEKGTKIASVSGKTEYAGVYTIPLGTENEVNLPKGTDYYVVVTTDKSAIDCEDATNIADNISSSNPIYIWKRTVNQADYNSYCKNAGSDMYNLSFNNFRIKAFTNDTSTHVHTWKEVSRTESTCKEYGVITYKCTDCSETKTEDLPYEHTYNSETLVSAATCESPAKYKKTCSVCGYSEEYKVGNALGHTWATKREEPTCTSTGKEYQECTRCKKQTSQKVIAALGHAYQVVDHKDATCISTGYKKYQCTRCKDSYTDTIAKKAHTYKIIGTKEATCTNKGSHTYRCTSCAHTYTTEDIAALGHTWKNKKVEPTCTSAGKEYQECTRCGAHSSQKTLSALGHSWNVIENHDATCTQEGYKKYKCSRCGSTYTNKISKKGHEWTTKRISPTCTSTGKEYQECTKCGAHDSEKTLSALGHSWSNWTTVQAATSSKEGKERRTCNRCGKVEERSISKLYVERVSMYRLYNPNSGEHFYTSNKDEKNNLTRLGWHYEGIGWNAPKVSNYPVYRLYNPIGGEHHYTLSVDEKKNLVRAGWKDEGIGWYSADPNGSDSIPVKREYNPNAFANNHNYTISLDEHNWLVGLGWKDEGTGWFALK